jgi:hypothetical protein
VGGRLFGLVEGAGICEVILIHRQDTKAQWKVSFSRLPFSGFPLFSALPERRVCGCSLRLRKSSQPTT